MGSRSGSRLRAFGVGLSLAVIGCSAEPESAAVPEPGPEAPLVVYAVSEPLRSFADRIGGAAVEVHFPIPDDVADPAFWSPDPETVAAYQAADLVLRNGGGYAAWVDRASLREARLVDTSAAFRERAIPLEAAVTHAHGPQGDHSHAGVATTFWLDGDLAREQARAVMQALVEARPDEATAFRERHAALDAKLAELDEGLAKATARLQGAGVLYSHPVYQYFDRRYGLGGRSLHWEPDAHPGEAEWQRLDAWLEEAPASVMIWEDTPEPETALRLRALGIGVIVVEPGGRTRDRDFLDVLEGNLSRLSE